MHCFASPPLSFYLSAGLSPCFFCFFISWLALIRDLWPSPQITLWWNSHRNTTCRITASPQRVRTTSLCLERPSPWSVSDAPWVITERTLWIKSSSFLRSIVWVHISCALTLPRQNCLAGRLLLLEENLWCSSMSALTQCRRGAPWTPLLDCLCVPYKSSYDITVGSNLVI